MNDHIKNNYTDLNLTNYHLIEDINPKKSRVKKACVECRRLKMKCNGDKPNCTRCLEKGILCSYEHNKFVKGTSVHVLNVEIKKYSKEIEEQKEQAQYWKTLYERIYPKFEHSPPETEMEFSFRPSEGIVFTNSHIDINKPCVSSNIDAFDYHVLVLCNRLINQYPMFGLHVDQLSFEKAHNLWIFLTQRVDTTMFHDFSFHKVVQMWEHCLLFLTAAFTFTQPEQETILWDNARMFMKYLIWERKESWPVYSIPYIVSNLTIMARMYHLKMMHGATMSCLLIAFDITQRAKENIHCAITYGVLLLLLMASPTSSDRNKWLNKAKDSMAQGQYEIHYIMAYCTSALNHEDRNADEMLTMSSMLLRLEQLLALPPFDEEYSATVKVYTQAIRAEISIRMGQYDIGMEWVRSCVEQYMTITDVGLMKITYIIVNTIAVSPFYINNNCTSTVREILKRVDELVPDIIR